MLIICFVSQARDVRVQFDVFIADDECKIFAYVRDELIRHKSIK